MRLLALLLVVAFQSIFAAGMPDTPLQDFVQRKMQEYGVPGCSVALIRDFDLAWAVGFGYANFETASNVSDDTLFLAGNASWPITAMVALTAFYKLQLPVDKSVQGLLYSWKLPPNNHRLSLIDLLKIRPDPPHDTALPTLQQILTQKPVKETTYLIVQQLLEDLYTSPFNQTADELIFSPLNMNESTYERPTHDVAMPYGPYMRELTLPSAPSLADRGLWSNPTDLAHFIVALQKGVANQKSSLPITAVRQFDRLFARKHRLLVSGYADGYMTTMYANLKKGYGVIIMANTSPSILEGEPVEPQGFMDDLIDHLKHAYRWK